MIEIAFYQLQKTDISQILPKLLEKTLKLNKKALVMASTKVQVENINDFLWSYKSTGWLPHGTDRDGKAPHQPIWISTNPEPLNQANYLFLTDGAIHNNIDIFERCFVLFNSDNLKTRDFLRGKWLEYKAMGYILTYWEETKDGIWQRNNNVANLE